MAQNDEKGDSSESADDSTTEYLSLEEKLRRNLERAIDSKVDLAIISAWTPQCEDSASLQIYLPQIKEAMERDAAFNKFMSALHTNDDTAIVQGFNPILNGYSRIHQQHWNRLSEAVEMYYVSCTFGQGGDDRLRQGTLLLRFARAYRTNDDEGIIDAYQAIRDAGYLIAFGITTQEDDRYKRAKTRVAIYQQFQQALDDGYLKALNDAYLLVRQNYLDLQQEHQDVGALAFRFIDTFAPYERGDDATITAENDADLISVYEEIKRSPHGRSIRLTPHELEQVQRAQQRQEDLQKIRAALDIGKPLDIDYVYGLAPALNENHLNPDERVILGYARRWAEAYRAHGNSSDHPDVMAIMKEIAVSPYRNRLYFTLVDNYNAARTTLSPGGDDQQDDLISQDEQSLIAIVEGTPISNKLFQQVYLVKQQYVWLRENLLQNTPRTLNDNWRWIASQRGVLKELRTLDVIEQQRIARQVLDDILDGFSTKKEIDSLIREDRRKVDQRLDTLYDEFMQRDGFQYRDFLQANGLTDDEVKYVLAMYARREFLAEDLVKRTKSPIDSWLASRRQTLKIEYPEQDQPEEQRSSGGWSLKSLIRLIDWFGGT